MSLYQLFSSVINIKYINFYNAKYYDALLGYISGSNFILNQKENFRAIPTYNLSLW